MAATCEDTNLLSKIRHKTIIIVLQVEKGRPIGMRGQANRPGHDK
jgi:hypothetical protein